MNFFGMGGSSERQQPKQPLPPQQQHHFHGQVQNQQHPPMRMGGMPPRGPPQMMNPGQRIQMLEQQKSQMERHMQQQLSELSKLDDSVRDLERDLKDKEVRERQLGTEVQSREESLRDTENSIVQVKSMTVKAQNYKATLHDLQRKLNIAEDRQRQLEVHVKDTQKAESHITDVANQAVAESNQWQSKVKAMEDEANRDSCNIEELSGLDSQFNDLQRAIGDEAAIRSKAVADSEWMRQASKRKTDEADELLKKLEEHSKSVDEQLATIEEETKSVVEMKEGVQKERADTKETKTSHCREIHKKAESIENSTRELEREKVNTEEELKKLQKSIDDKLEEIRQLSKSEISLDPSNDMKTRSEANSIAPASSGFPPRSQPMPGMGSGPIPMGMRMPYPGMQPRPGMPGFQPGMMPPGMMAGPMRPFPVPRAPMMMAGGMQRPSQ